MKNQNTCENCIYYKYDEEYDLFECQNYLDEDEWGRMMESASGSCPYFQFDNEYKIVKKQM